MILVGDLSRADLDRRLAEDPLHRLGLATSAVFTFHPSRRAEGRPL